jgi:hypothetical protein
VNRLDAFAGFAPVIPRRAHRSAVLIVERDQLAAMARVTAPADVVDIFEAARARAMAARQRIQPGRVEVRS